MGYFNTNSTSFMAVSAERKTYKKPELYSLGSVEQLTLGNNGSCVDQGGSQNPNPDSPANQNCSGGGVPVNQ